MNTSTQSTPQLSDLIQIGINYARGMWRYRWHAVVTVWLIALLGWLGVLLLKDKFEATARIYVDTENALQPLLRNIASSSNVIDEVNIVTRELRSRPNLAEVARATDLDLNAETESEFEQLLSNLQRKIKVRGERDQIYSIAFEHSDREKAVAVVTALVDTFVERSLGQDRSDQTQAREFLEAEIAQYERRLTEAEDRLARFKRENVEFMPGQSGGYFARLQAAEAGLKQSGQRLAVLGEQRLELERQISGAAPTITTSGVGAQGAPQTFQEQQLAQLRSELEVLRLQYTDRHPRIGQILDSIEALENQQSDAREALANSNSPEAELIKSQNPVYQNLRIQLSNIDVEMASIRAEQRQFQSDIAELELLVDTVPEVEAELGRLDRDYFIVKSKYEQLVEQLETASIGDSVSRSIDDVQFRLIEPPFAAEKPAGPNRKLFAAGVFVLALGGGGALAFLLNMLNPVFSTNSSVTRVTGLPVLTSVSLIRTKSQDQRRRRELAAFSASVLMVCAALVVFSALAPELSDKVQELLRRGVA